MTYNNDVTVLSDLKLNNCHVMNQPKMVRSPVDCKVENKYMCAWVYRKIMSDFEVTGFPFLSFVLFDGAISEHVLL